MATSLTRWDPITEVANMRTLMDRLFDQSFGRFPMFREAADELGGATLGLDVYETGNEYIVKAQLPGVDPKDVDITVDDDILTIKGEFEQKDDVTEGQFVRRELRYGSFQRSLRLPPSVEAEKANAQFEHGMLKLTLPKKPEARARSLKITPQGVLEGQKGESGMQDQQLSQPAGQPS
ncbi:MAG: Hsp20/alpha crystallin family protein [Dehalococcoidia bacterium]|nr:Hsp20/alpha crystallin family protein [Dehalococcoidia bacterium]